MTQPEVPQTEEEKKAAWSARRDSLLTPDHALPATRREYLSPSGKYRLVVTAFTREDGWSFTQGLVYRAETETLLVEVRRNYHSFPFLWIEGHAKGDFLLCGEDYQGQTVLKLNGRPDGALEILRRDFLPAEAKEGLGFCMAEATYDAATQILTLLGCFWAAPYEYRLYDFSDPMKGWPELELPPGAYVDGDGAPPEISPDGTVVCRLGVCDEETGEVCTPFVETSRDTYKREGSTLVLLEAWVSFDEQERRRVQAEATALHHAKFEAFKAQDPLYLAFKELLQDPLLVPDQHCGLGQTYEGWCPDFKENEPRYCQGIFKKEKHPLTLEIEWGMETGPIKLQVLRGNTMLPARFFPHSVAGMRAAFAQALQDIAQESP